MSQLASAISALFAATSAFAGGSITVSDGINSTGPITATFGRSTLVEDDAAGGRIEVVSNDFIIPLAALVLGGAQVLPAQGMRVTQVLNGRTYTYEVMTPPYRPGDSVGVNVRMHTKQVGVA